MSSEEKVAKTPQDQLLFNWFFNSERPYLDTYLKTAAQLGIAKEEAERLLDDWEAKGWMRRGVDWYDEPLVNVTENLFLAFAERYTIEQIREEAGRRNTKRFLTINGEEIETQTLVDILCAYITVKNGRPDEDMLTSLQDKVDGYSGHGFVKAFAPLLKVWAKDPDYQIMFWILSERVLERWVHDETDTWFSLNECRRFFIDLPPEKIDMLKACASDAAGLRLYALRNEFWLSPIPGLMSTRCPRKIGRTRCFLRRARSSWKRIRPTPWGWRTWPWRRRVKPWACRNSRRTGFTGSFSMPTAIWRRCSIL